jgi:hypothetical protein
MDSDQLRAQVAEIEKSGRLGKSRAYAKLLNFLMERSIEGPRPKEIEIAIEVFGRDASFDVSQDALVRVYVHKLRKKLRDYYDHGAGEFDFHLEIPRGSYQLDMVPARLPAADGLWYAKNRYLVPLLAGVVAVLVFSLWTRGTPLENGPVEGRVRAAQSFIWADILADSRPLIVVLGDLFVFSEINEYSEEVREIRDFGINSEADLKMYLAQNPDLEQRYRSYGVSFLPPNVALSLRMIMPVLLTSRRDTGTKVISQLTAGDIESHNIIYIGLLSSLGSMPALRDRVLRDSRFEAHTSYEVLIDREGGDIFAGEGDVGLEYSDRYLDYALVSRIGDAGEGRILAITAIRDIGLGKVVEALTDPDKLVALQNQARALGIDATDSLEVLYEIAGISIDTLEAMPRFITAISPVKVENPAQVNPAQGSSQ